MTILLRLLVITLILSSCAAANQPVTYVPTMPNEPMFIKPMQIHAKAAAGFDHVDIQAAGSVPFIGFTVSSYYAPKGIFQTQLGFNVYTPVTKTSDLFVSLSYGEGIGSCNFIQENGFSEGYKVNNKYNCFYLQPSIYHLYTKGDNLYKIALSFKHTELFFNYFDIKYANMFAVQHEAADNAYAVIQTPFLSFEIIQADQPFFFQFQAGYNFIKKSFKTIPVSFSSVSNSNKNPLKSMVHPCFQYSMLNISIGYKLH